MSKRFRFRPVLLAALATCAFVAAPSLAHAADLCVADAACMQAGNPNYVSLEGALAAAEASPAADRVLLGTGTFTAPTLSGFSAPQYPVEIIGHGADKTALTAPDGASPVLSLGNPASAVSNLEIVIPPFVGPQSKTGLEMTGGTASHLSIVGAIGASLGAIGAKLNGGLLQDSSVTLGADSQQTAVEAGTDARLSGVNLSAADGVHIFGADVQVDRARITAGRIGIWARRLNGRVTNSVVFPLLDALAVRASDGGQSNVSLTLRNDTIVGDGGDSSGVQSSSTVNYPVTVIVDSTVIHRVKYSLRRSSSSPAAASIGVLYSEFDPATIYDGAGPGVIATGEGDITADPLFTGPVDFHPLAGSPLIDAGNPAVSNDTQDVDGNPRIVGARRDIGAYEAPAPVPVSDPAPTPTGSAGSGSPTPDPLPTGAPGLVKDTLAPALTGLKIAPARFTARHGARLGFKLSEPATLTFVVKRRAAHGSRLTKFATLRRTAAAGAGGLAIRRKLAGVKLRPGRYVATVAAVDAAGNRSRSYKLEFRVVRG
jgi:hypothetical protein